MKLGAENRNKVIAAASLGVVAVVLLAWQFSGWFGGYSSSAASTTVTPSAPNRSSAPGMRQRGNAVRNSAGKKEPGESLDPSLRFDMLKTSEDTKYQGTGRNIFRVFVEPPPIAVAPVVTQLEQSQGPPPPPRRLRVGRNASSSLRGKMSLSPRKATLWTAATR